MTETLRIDTSLVNEAAGRLEALAGEIPPPPTAFSPQGADGLSVAIAGKVAEVVSPVLAQLPVTKEELTRYAQNVMNAANTYDTTDRQLAEEILKRLEQMDSADGRGGASPGGGGAGSAAAATTSAAGSAASPAAGAAGAASQGGQLGQMMGMPMQMAQQAAGMAASAPQGLMQGVQGAMQQVGQVSEMAGKDEQKPDGEGVESADADSQAAPGNTSGERVPDKQPAATESTETAL